MFRCINVYWNVVVDCCGGWSCCGDFWSLCYGLFFMLICSIFRSMFLVFLFLVLFIQFGSLGLLFVKCGWYIWKFVDFVYQGGVEFGLELIDVSYFVVFGLSSEKFELGNVFVSSFGFL